MNCCKRRNMNIQFCCGGNRLEGFNNYDADIDITQPLPFYDNSASLVFIEHGLEHINSHDALRFCREVYRILKPDGRLRVCVPELERIEDRAHAADLILGHGHQMIYSQASLFNLLWTAGFDRLKIRTTGRAEIDSHWKVISKEKDDLETLRMEATK